MIRNTDLLYDDQRRTNWQAPVHKREASEHKQTNRHKSNEQTIPSLSFIFYDCLFGGRDDFIYTGFPRVKKSCFGTIIKIELFRDIEDVPVNVVELSAEFDILPTVKQTSLSSDLRWPLVYVPLQAVKKFFAYVWSRSIGRFFLVRWQNATLTRSCVITRVTLLNNHHQ